MFMLVGIVALPWPWAALLPAGIYLLICIAEGEIITPLLLAKSFYAQPSACDCVAVFLSLKSGGGSRSLTRRSFARNVQDYCRSNKTLQPAGNIVGA
jgi:hypothetical protein